MTSSPATASCDFIMVAPQFVFPTITHGDTTSVVFGISKGNSISKLRTEKARMDNGEIKSCEGCFTVKFMTGTPQRLLYNNSTCEMILRIDLIDDTECGLQISGTITSVSHGHQSGGYRNGSRNLNNPAGEDWKAELDLLHEGTRIKLIHRGAAAPGAIVYIHDVEVDHIHLPHIPPEILQPMENTGAKKSTDIAATRYGSFAAYRGGRRRSLPYRY